LGKARKELEMMERRTSKRMKNNEDNKGERRRN